MAEPWTDDLAALGEASRSQLRSLAATRAAVLSQEPKMRLYKQRPVLSALIALVVLAVAAPIAYAIGSRIFVSIDPNKSAQEIEQDVQSQFQQAGVQATVHADKQDGQIEVQIQTADPELAYALAVAVPGGSAASEQTVVRTEVACTLTDAQQAQFMAVLVAVAKEKPDAPQDQLQAALADGLAQAGFHDVEIHAEAGTITVKVKAPPT